MEASEKIKELETLINELRDEAKYWRSQYNQRDGLYRRTCGKLASVKEELNDLFFRNRDLLQENIQLNNDFLVQKQSIKLLKEKYNIRKKEFDLIKEQSKLSPSERVRLQKVRNERKKTTEDS